MCCLTALRPATETESSVLVLPLSEMPKLGKGLSRAEHFNRTLSHTLLSTSKNDTFPPPFLYRESVSVRWS